VTRVAEPAVDEMFRNRHEVAARPAVESPSRAAGGFPTLGGGMRTLPRPDLAGPVAAIAVRPDPSEGGA
jgi:hypothetical protein